MASKIFVTADELLLDAFKLAKKIFESDFKPNKIMSLWRGGAPVGVYIHEYFHYKGRKLDSKIIRAESYTGVDKRKDVIIHPFIEDFTASDKVLIVDDIFDTGKTSKAVLDKIKPLVSEAKIAAVYQRPSRNETDINPDFSIKIVEQWVVFPHEIVDLDDEELHIKNMRLFDVLK